MTHINHITAWIMPSSSFNSLKIITPDSSHWAKWCDAANSHCDQTRSEAMRFHNKILQAGYVPLLCFHHLEEICAIENPERVEQRIRFIQQLPFVAAVKPFKESKGTGAIADILMAEASVLLNDKESSLNDIRDQTKNILLSFGTGSDAVGEHSSVWNALQPFISERRDQDTMITALSEFRPFDETLTVGEICKNTMRSNDQVSVELTRIQLKAFKEVLTRSKTDPAKAKIIAEKFKKKVKEDLPPDGYTIKDMIVKYYTNRGIHITEIQDDTPIYKLTELGLHRSHLKIIASESGLSFDALKQIPREMFPSFFIQDTLKKYGQKRYKRPGSDFNDQLLAALGAYSDILLTDKRTHQDFVQSRRKSDVLDRLIGQVKKSAKYTDMFDM